MHSNLVIKQQKTKPWYIGVGSLVVLLFTASYLTGRYLAISDLSETKQQLASVELELAETKSALDNLNEQLVMQA